MRKILDGDLIPMGGDEKVFEKIYFFKEDEEIRVEITKDRFGYIFWGELIWHTDIGWSCSVFRPVGRIRDWHAYKIINGLGGDKILKDIFYPYNPSLKVVLPGRFRRSILGRRYNITHAVEMWITGYGSGVMDETYSLCEQGCDKCPFSKWEKNGFLGCSNWVDATTGYGIFPPKDLWGKYSLGDLGALLRLYATRKAIDTYVEWEDCDEHCNHDLPERKRRWIENEYRLIREAKKEKKEYDPALRIRIPSQLRGYVFKLFDPERAMNVKKKGWNILLINETIDAEISDLLWNWQVNVLGRLPEYEVDGVAYIKEGKVKKNYVLFTDPGSIADLYRVRYAAEKLIKWV